MFLLHDIRESRVYQETREEGLKEGREIGRVLGREIAREMAVISYLEKRIDQEKRMIISKLAARRFPPADIAKTLEWDVDLVTKEIE